MFERLRSINFKKKYRGQSFVELALVLPILLLLLLGVTEVAFYMGAYMDVLDLTRETARFASARDPFALTGDLNCSTTDELNFFYDSACMISPPAGSTNCVLSEYCNGFNPYISFNPDTDDVVISVFTITGTTVSDQWPSPNGRWALSNVNFVSDTDSNYTADDSPNSLTDNFRKDCKGNVIRSEPYFTEDEVESRLLNTSPHEKGYVAVEVYYCYNQVFNIPLFSIFVPNPIQIHAYTLMPLPGSIPTPTPIP